LPALVLYLLSGVEFPTASTTSRLTRASILLQEAVQRYHRAGLPHHEAEVRLTLAESLLATQDVGGSSEQILVATAVLTELPDAVGLACARRLTSSLGQRSPQLLTSREVEALRLVSRGLSNEDIATSLVLSKHTVHRHVANILTKLDEPTGASAVSHALTNHMI
jgi:DNA-binding NarL/FixJ family response regulator